MYMFIHDWTVFAKVLFTNVHVDRVQDIPHTYPILTGQPFDVHCSLMHPDLGDKALASMRIGAAHLRLTRDWKVPSRDVLS